MADIVTTDQLLAEIADYWNKRPDSNLYKLVDIYNSGFNRIANDLETVDDWRAIKEAEGTTLDLIGEDEQAYRVTQDDDAYRFWIWIKFLMARAQGTYPSFMKIGSSSLGTDQGFNIWKTSTRHVGIQIPYDLIPNLPTDKLITENLQNMLALGIWIGEIHLPATIKGTLHGGAVMQDEQKQEIDGKALWWTGWDATIKGNLYLGTAQTTKNVQGYKALWWRGWSSDIKGNLYLGAGQTAKTIHHMQATWFHGWQETDQMPIHFGIAGACDVRTHYDQKAKWSVSWSDQGSANLNAGASQSESDTIGGGE